MAQKRRHEAVVYRARQPLGEGHCESFNGKLCDECLNEEIFYSLKEALVVISMWRKYSNTVRPHSSLGSID